jgi:ABC-2 type transport system permease protein
MNSVAWAVSDHWEMAKRSLRHIRNDPEQLGNVTMTPIVTVLLVNFVFGGAIKTETHGSYINFFMPGIFAAVAAFAAVTTTIGVAADMHQGVMDRLRTLPIAKSSVVTGHVIADLARSLIGLAATVAVGYAVGFRPSASPASWAVAIAVILLLTFALSWLAALIGLLGKSPEVATQLAAIVVIPVFLSSALVPTATMPSWLRVVTANQPITQAIDTLRAVLAGQAPGSHLWLALAELAGIIVAAFTLATTLFRRQATNA